MTEIAIAIVGLILAALAGIGFERSRSRAKGIRAHKAKRRIDADMKGAEDDEIIEFLIDDDDRP